MSCVVRPKSPSGPVWLLDSLLDAPPGPMLEEPPPVPDPDPLVPWKDPEMKPVMFVFNITHIIKQPNKGTETKRETDKTNKNHHNTHY